MQIRFYKYLLLALVIINLFISNVYGQGQTVFYPAPKPLPQQGELFSVKDLGLPDNVSPHPSMPNVFVQTTVDPDTKKTVETILVATTVDGKREIVPIESMSTKELMPLLKQDTNLWRAIGGTAANFHKEYGKFNAAMIAMEIVGCYGVGNGTLFSEWKWQPETNTNTPLCAEHLLKAMTTLEGNLGFFAFILGNRISSAHLTNLATATSLMINKPLTPKRMAALRPLIGYAGMSFGMAAQQIVSHILTIPDFKQCAKDIASGQFGSPACKSAATHFLSAEKFWMDFGAGIPSLIGGAMMSAGTQKFIHFLAENGKFSGPTLTTKKARVEFLKRFFSPSNVRRVFKVGKNIVRVGKMGAGVGIVVGEIVIFLVWTKVLEIPTMQWVWSLYDSPDVKSNAQNLLNVSSEIEKKQGIPNKDSNIFCHEQLINARGATKRVCNPDLLAQSLKDMNFYSRRYRERVTLARLSRSYPDYMMKWEDYITAFFAGKFLIQEIYRQREEKPTTQLSLYDTTFAVLSTWKDYFKFSNMISRTKADHEILKNQMDAIERAFLNLKPDFLTGAADQTRQNKLADLLIQFKASAEKQKKFDYTKTNGGVTTDVYAYNALKILKLIPQNKNSFFSENRDSNISFNLEFMHQMNQSLPLDAVLRQFLCEKNATFSSQAKMNGLPARLDFPRIALGLESNKQFQESCNVAEARPILAVDLDESEDFVDPKPESIWILNSSEKNPLVYIDPLSPLTDARIRLASGSDSRSALQWWNQNILPEILVFYKKYISHYKTMLNDNLLAFINQDKPQILLDTMTSSTRGGGDKDKALAGKVLNRQSVNLSLIGQMQIYAKALEKVTNGFYPGPNKQKIQIKQNIDAFLLLFAEHTRHFYYNNEPSSLDAIPLENITSPDPFLFSQDVAKTLFADSYEKKSQRQEELSQMIGTLSSLLGANYNEVDNISAALDLKPEQVAALSLEEYKKYTVLQIVHHMRLLVDETNEYYDKYLFLTGLFNLTKK